MVHGECEHITSLAEMRPPARHKVAQLCIGFLGVSYHVFCELFKGIHEDADSVTNPDDAHMGTALEEAR